MKKTILFMFAMVIAVAAFSQERQRDGQARRRQMDPETMAMAQTQNLQEVLQLDSLQFQAVYLMNYSDAMAMQDSMKVRKERGERVQPTEEERKARAEVMKKRQEVRNEQMKQILTEEQYEKYLKYMKKSARNGRPNGERRGGGERGGEPFE